MAAPEAPDPAQAGSDPARPVGLTFGDFLAKMKDPAAADLVRNIKRWARPASRHPLSLLLLPAGTAAERACCLLRGSPPSCVRPPLPHLLVCSFIRQFEERPAGQTVDPEADSAAVQAFLAQSEALFRQHPVWRGCQPEVLDQAVEVGAVYTAQGACWRSGHGFGGWGATLLLRAAIWAMCVQGVGTPNCRSMPLRFCCLPASCCIFIGTVC